jgi:hypothetical protein
MSETRILLRRDSAQNWFDINPRLSPGEIGYCTDTRQIKIGNGTTNWNDLPHTYNPTYEGTKPYSVVLTNHTFTALTGANTGKTNILVVGLFPAKVPTNVGVSAYLYVSTGASSRRLLRKVPVTLSGSYSVGIGFTNMISTDMVYLGEYTVEVLGETQELIGKYTFTYRPVLNALKLDMFLETDRRARIQIYNPMTISSGTVVVRRRSDLGQVGAAQPIEDIEPVSGASFNTVLYDLNPPVAFVDNVEYFCEINYNKVNDLYATSEVVKCSQQKVLTVTFDANENRAMNIQIEDGNLKVQSLSVFPCNSSGSVNIGTTAIGTLTIPGGGLQSGNVYTINLSRTLLHEEYYLFQYVYSTEPYNSPPRRFIQLVTLNDITISSDNSITTSIEIEGSGYNVALTAREGSSTGPVFAEISGPVSIFKDSIDPIATYTGSVLNPATSFFTPVEYSTPKPFYALGFSPFLPYEKNGIFKVTDANKALMLDALQNALHYSYRLRLYPISDLLQLMLETIHTYKGDYPELAKIRIYASVSPIYVTEQTPIYNYQWITQSAPLTLVNLQNRLIKPLLKFGTENIIGVIVGNEDLHRECANPNTSNMRKNYLFNVLVVAINEVREFLLNPVYDGTRLPGTAIKMVPVGISDAPNEIVFNSKFGEARTAALVKLCDFVMLNNHPFYDAIEYGNALQWESNFQSLLTSSTAYIASLSPPDNPCHCIIGEWGWPTGWEWPVIQTTVSTPTPTNIIDYSTTATFKNAKYIGATDPLTPAIQRDWIKRILKKYQSNYTSSGTAPDMPIDMVYFGFMDNHAESQPLSKGSYVRTWGLCRVDIQTIEGVDNTQAGHDVAPADSTTYVAVDGNEDASSTEIAIYNRRTKITKKHQGNFDIATFLTTNGIPLHITNTANDLIFRTEYPEVTVTTLPALKQFIAGTSYHFSIKAGGYANNVRYSIPSQILPYNGDDLYIIALRFASFNSIKVVASTNTILSNVIFDIVDEEYPNVIIGSTTVTSAPNGSLITTVPLTGFPTPPAIPPTASDSIPVAPTSISNWSETTSYSVGAKVKVGNLFYNCLYANRDLQPGIPIPDFNSVLSYAVGDVVFVSGVGLVRCNTDVSSPVAVPPNSNWDLLISAFNSGVSSYAVGDVVFVKGKGLFRCKTAVSSPVAVPPNSNWDLSFPAFSSSVNYAVGNIVFVSGAGLFRCKTAVSSPVAVPPNSNWELLFSAFSSSVSYAIGDVVFVSGAGLFRCKTAVPASATAPPNSNWELSFPDFKSVVTYDVGNMVFVTGQGSFRCKTEVSSPETPPNSNWDLLFPTNDITQVWESYSFITSRTVVNKPVTLPASSATFFQYGRSYAVKVRYDGGIPFQSDPLVFESQIASFGTDGNNRIKLDILWFDREPRSLKQIPVSELPDESELRASGTTATPAFFANISSADITLYEYTNTVGGVFNTPISARLQPILSNYASVITSDGSTDRIFIMKSDTTGLPITLDNYYGDEIFIRIIYKAEVPAKRSVAGTVTEKIKVYQSLTLIGTVKKKVQFEQAAVSKSYINIAQDVIFGTLTINNEDGPDFKYGSTDFIQIVPKLITNTVPPTVLSSTTLNNGKYELNTTPLNLVDNTTYAVGFYARRPDSTEVFIASQPIKYVNYSDVSFSLDFLTDQRLRVTANFSTYAKKRVKLELYGSSTTSITQQHTSLASQYSPVEFYIAAGNTSGTIELKDPFTFNIGYYYSVKTTIYAYDDESYSDTVVSTTPVTNSVANRFIYNTCDFLSPTIDIFSGIVTIRILWSTYSGTPVVPYLNLISDQEVTYARKRITLNATGSNQTYSIPLNAADLLYPLVPTDSYYIYLEFDRTGYITPNSSTFVYNPITLRVLSITSKTISTVKTTTFELDWGGPPSGTQATASVILKSAPDSPAISTLNIAPGLVKCEISGNYKSGDEYTFIVKYGTRELVSNDFYYAEIVATATNVVFKDDIGDIISDNLGYLTATIDIKQLPTHNTLKFELYEFTQENTQLDGILVNTKNIVDNRANYVAILTFVTQFFRINKWYNVKYLVNEAGDFLFANNIRYLPKGYDIIVIAGGSNQVGEDTDTTRGDLGGYTIARERGGDPQLTTTESTSPLIDKNNKIVKIYNLKATGGTYTTNALTNEDVPYLHRAIAPFQQFSSVEPPSATITYGITAGYEFAKYYASSNVLRSNRRVVVINEAIPSSVFAIPASGTGGTVWNPSSNSYVADYYDNVKNSIRDVSIRNTYSNIVPDRNKLTHANVGKSPKLGCKISLSNSMIYSQQIVDNFQYCYFVNDTMLKNIHPNQGNILTGFSGLPTSDATIRAYIQNELKSLNGTTVSGHTIFPFQYTPAGNEYTFNAFKHVMNFIVENELTLRINGLVGPDSTVGFWLNGLTRPNAIYAIMRHCYTVVSWFNTNYPGIVFAYDVIRNHFTEDAPNTGVYATNAYAKSNTDTLYAEAAFVGAYAALRATSSTADLSWSESLVDNISIRFPYRRGSVSYGADRHTITFQNALAGILSQYVGVGCDFPITGISIQGKYNIGDFIESPTAGTGELPTIPDLNIFNDTLFHGTTDFLDGGNIYNPSFERSLLKLSGDSRGIPGVTLLERIAAFRITPSPGGFGYQALTKNLPVTITETELNVSKRFGNDRTEQPAYWGGATYSKFRVLQSQYFRTLHRLLVDNPSLNINTDYLGVGELVSNPLNRDLTAFFFSGATAVTTTETGVLADVITYIRTYSSASSDYTANRVVAFLWNQGEANRPAFDNNATYVTYITSFINGLMSNTDIKRVRLDDAVYLIGNLSIEHTARQMILVSPPITSYGIHENIDNYAIVDRKVQPITSLGLHCIDPNIPTTINTATTPPSFPTISFSARSQRLMGARYFNGYLANTGNTDTATYPIYRSETGHVSIPLIYDINLDSKLLTFNNESSSYDYTKHPIAYFLQTRFYTSASTFGSTAVDRIALITEYSSTNKPSASEPGTPLAIVPYFDMNSETIVSENSPISLNTYSVSSNVVSSKLNAVNDVITATYTYDPAVFKKDASNAISRIGNKTLTSNLTSYLDTVSNDFTTNPTYLGSASIIGIIKRSILGGSPNFSIVFNNYFRIPPYTFVETPKIDTTTSISSSSIESSTNGTAFTLPTSIYVPSVVRSSYVNGIIYVGTHAGQFGSPTPSGAHYTTGVTFPPAATQVTLTSSTTSSGVNRSSYGQDIQGTTRVAGLSAAALAGIFTGEGTWGTLGASSASPTTYTASGNGRLYTIATKGLDWIMFISRARFYTQRILKAMTNYHILGDLANSIPAITTLNPPFYYPCATAGSQFAGISRIPLSVSNRLMPVSGSYTPTFKYFMYLFNAETSIIFRLNNVTVSTTYTLSFYFSVKSGRVPHESTYSTSPASSLTTTSTIDTGATATSYPALYEIYDPLPINIYYSDPRVGAERSPDFTYNLNFKSGTSNVNNLYLHTSSAKWDGSWRLVSLTFTTPAAAIPAGNCYVQLGPLPYRNMIDTSFNFGGFSTKINNT